MKINLRLGPPGPLTRERAWICFSMNMGFPGSGSLMARRLVGYPQAVLTISGILLTLFFGGRFVTWFFANWSRLQNPGGDPLETMREIWMAVRWALAGMGLFALAWLWGLATGLTIVSRAKREQQGL